MNPLRNAPAGAFARLFLGLLAPLLAACGGSRSPGGVGRPVDRYDSSALVAMRAEKDLAFRGADSPLPATMRDAFAGLAYYPPDPTLAFEVPLELFDDPEPVSVAATGGDVRTMTRYGRFTFDVGGTRCSLTVYKSDPGSPHLFVPFNDRTNGGETYEVGRYIDLEEHTGSEPYLLDFNLSYNPYCAYNETYTCPIVPAENALDVAIPAGEKLPTWGAHP